MIFYNLKVPSLIMVNETVGIKGEVVKDVSLLEVVSIRSVIAVSFDVALMSAFFLVVNLKPKTILDNQL